MRVEVQEEKDIIIMHRFIKHPSCVQTDDATGGVGHLIVCLPA